MSLKDLDAATVGSRLGLGEKFSSWLEELATFDPPSSPISLPDVHETGELFERLGVSPDDAVEILDAWPEPHLSPELEWLLQRCHLQLVAQINEPYPLRPLKWQPLPSHLGTAGRLFYIYVFLTLLPIIRQWHLKRGISDEVSWATLADFGEHIAIHRRIFGSAGLFVPNWLTYHFRGILYRLGRLQFERWRLSPKWPIYDENSANDETGPRPDPGASALSIHIPESGGSMSPEACAASLELARSFFARHFPEENYRFARCISWLLDPQLANYLPPTSNILTFQRLFHLIPGGTDCDEDVIMFVFRRVAPSLDELPQRTTLERAIVQHIRDGRHWQYRSGWFRIS